MNRRTFLDISFPATGAILVAPGFLNAKLPSELYQQFSGEPVLDRYDVVINGAGLKGYFAALHAAELGRKVLVVDKRSSPGYDITAKRRLWIGTDGQELINSDLKQLLFPEGEKVEIGNSRVKGEHKSLLDNEFSLFNGSIRKGLLRNLLLKKIHVLLMTDVCGISTDGRRVKGVMLASKHGVYMVGCTNFIDASDRVLFSRSLLGQPYQIERASFVFEVLGVKDPYRKLITVSEKHDLINNQIEMRQGKQADDLALISFDFIVKSQNIEDIEHQARLLTASLGENFTSLDPSLRSAKVHQFALESSVHLKDPALPKVNLNGHYVLGDVPENLDCRDLVDISEKTKKVVSSLRAEDSKRKASEVWVVGHKIPMRQITLTDLEVPGLRIPLKKCSFDFHESIHHVHKCQVIVGGGGTAGAMAGMGSVERGTTTIVVDYFNDLGGTKTMGGVMGYYHGYKKHAFFKKQNDQAAQLAHDHNFNNETGRKLFHLKKVTDGGNKFFSGSIICGSIVKDQTVEGIVICRNGRLEKIVGEITIDATGDGDIADFASARFKHGDSRTGITQNYSQWDYQGAAKELPSPTGRDYDLLDTTVIPELQRGLFLSHYQAHFYDFHPMLTVRESRRVEGLYTLDLIDASEGTRFRDVMTKASSDFDPHNVGSSEYSKCGFLLPHSNDLVMEIPYRAIVPKGIDGLLISGRGFSQTHNAYQFTRMSGDLAVLGYLTGQVAADLAWKKIQPKDYDISELQKEWAALGYLSSDYATRTVGNSIEDKSEIERRVRQLAGGAQEYLYECAKVRKENIVPALRQYFSSTVDEAGKLLLAKSLAWFGERDGSQLIVNELEGLYAEELQAGYERGFRDTYDDIRGREKNMLVGLYWRINQNIALLAMSGSSEGHNIIEKIINEAESGGGMVKRENDYFNGRIDLRLVPYYNRIMNLCFYSERIPDKRFINGLEQLLIDEHIVGFVTEEYDKTRWRVYGGFLELTVAASLARCGSKKGYELLTDYIDDIHYNFKNFAVSELKNLTGKDFGYNSGAWASYIEKLAYPRPAVKVMKALEV